MEATFLTDPAFWASSSAHAPGDPFEPPEGVGPGLVYFRTSGSTGEARWIGLTRESLLLSAAVVNRHLGVGEDSCWGLALPLNHVGGFGVCARAFEAGCRFAGFPGRWDPVRFSAWAASEGVTHLSLVPTQVHDLVRAGVRAPDGLAAVVVGGGVLGEEDGLAARRSGWPVLASYGMTEAGSQVATQGLELLDVPYSPSPVPVLLHWEVSAGADGRLMLRGESLFTGQLVREQGGWRYVPREDGWYVTGDVGRVGPGGIEVLGRADLFVKILGELVDPVAVERELGTNGVAVVAVPDDRAGHRLVAVCDRACEGSDVEAVVDAYNARVSGFLRIAAVVRIDRIPTGGLGKVRRRELSEMLRDSDI